LRSSEIGWVPLLKLERCWLGQIQGIAEARNEMYLKYIEMGTGGYNTEVGQEPA